MFQFNNVSHKCIVNIDYLMIPAAKINCIVGESGCGKTTLLRLLNKLESPERGMIRYQGKLMEEIDSIALRRTVVMLPQVPAIFPGNVRNNLEIGLKFSEKPLVSEDILLETLATVHLKKALSDDAEKLSGGEKQRLALGRLILMDPDVLLLDEPSSALDEETEQMVIEKTVNLTREKGKTLIMVTHAKRIAQDFSDHIIEMQNGQVVQGSEA